MPPWKPEYGHGEFTDERRLPESQKRQVLRWIEQGAPEGEPGRVPPAPRFTDGWQLGQPDLVVSMPEAFEVPAAGPDIFRNFVVALAHDRRRYVRAWEFRPGNPRAVHHATIGFDRTRASRELDAGDGAPGYEGVVPFSVANPDGYFLGWSPGQRQPQRALPRMPWSLPASGDVMFSMHLRPTGRRERVAASLGLYFTDDAPEGAPVTLRLGRQDIDIPAGAAEHVISNQYRLPIDVELHSVYPHAHHLAREVRAWALLPDGNRRPLLLIADWDFNWQDVYRYATPVSLPAGSTVHMQYTYDNSGHRAHGDAPPRRVTYGPNSSDEMGDLVAASSGTRAPVPALRWWPTSSGSCCRRPSSASRLMSRNKPADVGIHDELGLLYQESREFERAVAHFSESLRLNPRSAASHSNLGSALLNQGRLVEARQHFLDAIQLDQAYATAHFNLGLVTHLEGRLAEAVSHYRTAVRLRAGYAEAHQLLGTALDSLGNVDEAMREYRRAIAAQADWPIPLIQLAWTLATAPTSDATAAREALSLAERAVALSTPPSAASLDAWAAALARLGRFEQATAAASQARDAATRAGDSRLAALIEARLEQYRRREPFVVR